MTRITQRRKAIELRKQGKTYKDIRIALGIPKSTLSDWLREYPLTENQTRLLEKNQKTKRAIAVEKTRVIKRIKRENRIHEKYKVEQEKWKVLNKRELELAGLMLYWGEGNKRIDGPISLNNTDPYVLKFTLYWYEHGLQVSREKIRVSLHLYKDMNKEQEMKYWSRLLNLPLRQFSKPYIKNSLRVEIDHKGFGHGTCGLVINNVLLKEKVMMGIKAIADLYSEEK